jgi:hypothetical protein
MFALATLFDSYTWAALVVTVLYAIVAAVLFLARQEDRPDDRPHPARDRADPQGGRAMGEDPEQLRAEIAQTRAELGKDLDVLVEKVSPAKVVERRGRSTKEAVASVKDKGDGLGQLGQGGRHGLRGLGEGQRDGTPARPASRQRSAGSARLRRQRGPSLGRLHRQRGRRIRRFRRHRRRRCREQCRRRRRWHRGGHPVLGAETARRKEQGNPLAAGVVAFGLGWLVSSLLPASKVEQQGALKVKEAAQAVAEPVKEGLSSVAGEVKEHLAPAAQDAVTLVKQEATDAVQTVKEQAADAGSQVKEQATGSASSVAETAKSSASDAKEQATSSPTPDPYAGSYPPPSSTAAYPVAEPTSDVYPDPGPAARVRDRRPAPVLTAAGLAPDSAPKARSPLGVGGPSGVCTRACTGIGAAAADWRHAGFPCSGRASRCCPS